MANTNKPLVSRTQLEAIKVKNSLGYKDISLGIPNGKKSQRIQQFCVFVGPNGVGKSSFFNIFKFLSLCVRENATKAITEFGGWHLKFKSPASISSKSSVNLPHPDILAEI